MSPRMKSFFKNSYASICNFTDLQHARSAEPERWPCLDSNIGWSINAIWYERKGVWYINTADMNAKSGLEQMILVKELREVLNDER